MGLWHDHHLQGWNAQLEHDSPMVAEKLHLYTMSCESMEVRQRWFCGLGVQACRLGSVELLGTTLLYALRQCVPVIYFLPAALPTCPTPPSSTLVPSLSPRNSRPLLLFAVVVVVVVILVVVAIFNWKMIKVLGWLCRGSHHLFHRAVHWLMFS